MKKFSLYKYSPTGRNSQIKRGITYKPSLDYVSTTRYSNLRTISDSLVGVYHETTDNNNYPQSAGDLYYEVEVKYSNRLDIISNIAYNNPQFYWAIAEANAIIDCFDVPIGTVLRVPTLETIYSEVL